MTCIDKLPRSSAFLETVPRPSAVNYLGNVPWPSAIIRHGASA